MSVRFAPSPTGRFHVGNLRTAWISHEFSRVLGAPWIVRFEDIDQPRVIPGAQDTQLDDMRAIGLVPDQIVIQSDHRAQHESLFRRAIDAGKIYPCSCSRREILQNLQEMASAPHGEAPIYDGRCRNPKNRRASSAIAWRFLNLEDPAGRQDFIIARTNPAGSQFLPSYHWACAIDDYEGDHKLLVRAWDLAHVVSLQRRIHRWVGETFGIVRDYPAVFHTSLVVSENGHRLEKRTQGVTLPELTTRGISPLELTEKFSTSFEKGFFKQFRPSAVFGEALQMLPLSRLGL